MNQLEIHHNGAAALKARVMLLSQCTRAAPLLAPPFKCAHTLGELGAGSWDEFTQCDTPAPPTPPRGIGLPFTQR